MSNDKMREAETYYAERDIDEIDELGNHYARHVCAMTAEGLHSKSAIAAELAYRDLRIEELEAALTQQPESEPKVRVEYDLSPAGIEGKIRDKLIELGWTPPGKPVAGTEAAAQWVENRRDAYIAEHGSYDPDTGATEFPGDGGEYVCELDEIAEGIRSLNPIPASAQVPEGWRPVPIVSIQKLLGLIDPEPVRLPTGKTMIYKNPDAANILSKISAEVRAMLSVAPSIAEKREPSHYVVLDEEGQIQFSVAVKDPISANHAKSMMHEHINDAINGDVEGAASWVVRVVTGLQRPELPEASQ